MPASNTEQEQASFELLANQPIDGGANSLALVSDGSVFYNGRPCISGGEPVVLDTDKTELLQILLNTSETPMTGDAIWYKGYGNSANSVRQQNEKLENDLSALGNILKLDSHIVRVGTVPSTYYAFTADARNLDGITSAFDYGMLRETGIKKGIFTRYANRETYWYGAEPLRTSKASESAGVLATGATVNTSGVSRKNKGKLTHESARPFETETVTTVQIPAEVTAARNKLSDIPGLNQELDMFGNTEMLLVAELVRVPRNGRESIANIVDRLRHEHPSYKDVPDILLRDYILGLIGRPASSVPRYLPQRFSLKVSMTEEEKHARDNGIPLELENDRFHLQRIM